MRRAPAAISLALVLASLMGCEPSAPVAGPGSQAPPGQAPWTQPSAGPQLPGQPIPGQPIAGSSVTGPLVQPYPGRPAAGSPDISLADYVPADAVVVSVLWPRRSLSKPEVAILPIQDMIEKMAYADLSVDLRAPGVFLRASRIRLPQVEQVIHVVDSLRTGLMRAADASTAGGSAQAEQDPEFFGSVIDAFILRFAGPAPREGAMAMLFRPQEVTLAGRTYYGRGRDDSRTAAFFPDDRTIILGEETLLRKMIVHQTIPARGPVSDFLRSQDPDSDIASLVQWQRLGMQLPIEVRRAGLFQSLSGGMVTAKVLIRLNARPSLRLVLDAKTPDAAAQLDDAVRQWIQAAGQYGNSVQTADGGSPGQPPTIVAADWERLASRALAAMRVEPVGKRVEITLIDFIGLRETFALVELLATGGQVQLASAWEPLAQPKPNDDATAAEIRQLIPAAAGIRLNDFLAFASSGDAPKPEQINEHPLSLGLMNCWKYDEEIQAVYRARFEEFRFLSAGDPDPSQMAQVMGASSWLGYCSMIQPEYITELTCSTSGQTAKGTVAFRVPGLFEGKVQYAAGRIGGAWQILEFEMPAHTWKFTRDQRGLWHWNDRFGEVTDPRRAPADVQVMGRVTWRRQPLSSGQVEFFHNQFPEWPFAGKSLRVPINPSGLYAIDLPKGSYYVRLVDGPADVPSRYSRLDTSGLRIEVNQQEQVANFNLQ